MPNVKVWLSLSLSFAFTITLVFRRVNGIQNHIVFELVNIGSKLSAIVFKLANSGAMPPKSETTTETITEMYYSIDALRAKFGEQCAQKLVEETKGIKLDGVMHWPIRYEVVRNFRISR